jgi:flagellar hook-length control protein FliK
VIDFIAHSEPVAVQHAANEQPQSNLQAQETEKRENHCSFDELLAGMLRDDIPMEKVNEVALPIENAEMEKLEMLSIDTLNVSAFSASALSNSEAISDIALSEEDQNILLSAGHFFSRSLESSFDADGIEDIPAETPHSKTEHLAEIKLQSEILSAAKEPVKQDITSHVPSAELASAQYQGEQIVKETLSAENRKEQAPIRNENAEAHSSIAKAGEEKIQTESNSSRNRQEERGLLDEIRNRSRHDRLAFEVRDMRTSPQAHITQTGSGFSMEAAAIRGTEAQIPDITLELRLPDFNNAGQNAQTTWEGKASTAIENMLARELHQNFNGDIVRHASMALRDGGESTIKLALRPEALGNVKIRLEMTENKITGFIVVESEEALNAFRKEIASLEQAFKDAGFADASLDLSMSDGKNEWQELNEGSLSSQRVASGYEKSLRDAELDETALLDIFFGRTNGDGAGQVNMLA